MKYQAASLIAVLCLLTTAALPRLALGQDGAESNTPERSQAELRREVHQAEEDFYALFNQLNDERDFNVRCRYEKPTGSNIKNHVCRARFVSKAYQRHARRNRNNLSSVANQDADPIFAKRKAEYEEHMEALIAANPELQAAFDRYNAARLRFMAKRTANDGI